MRDTTSYIIENDPTLKIETENKLKLCKEKCIVFHKSASHLNMNFLIKPLRKIQFENANK